MLMHAYLNSNFHIYTLFLVGKHPKNWNPTPDISNTAPLKHQRQHVDGTITATVVATIYQKEKANVT